MDTSLLKRALEMIGCNLRDAIERAESTASDRIGS